jgi:hypothetical protein
MATTSYREDYLGRDLAAPTVAALDALGRVTTATVDYMGRPLRRLVRTNGMNVTLGQEIQFTGGSKYTVTTLGDGSLAGSPPSIPAVGATVDDGGVTLTRTK